MYSLISHQIRPLGSNPFQMSFLSPPSAKPQILHLPHKAPLHSTCFASKSSKTHQTNLPSKNHKKTSDDNSEDGIPSNFVKTLVKFKSRHNHIKVLEVSRRADHPLAGSRLLLLDAPGNIHSISFLFKLLTATYFDVFATFPPILPPGPIAVLGFGAGSAARIILQLYPDSVIHGWELDPSVISVGREYFGLQKLEKQHPDKLFIYIGDALQAEVRNGFSGILVDLFSKGSLVPELQEPKTWEKMKRSLRRGGRIMVNCGGRCVESEDPKRDGDLLMEETLKAMSAVFADQLFVLNLSRQKDDSCAALTGPLPDVDSWKENLPSSALRCYVDMWQPYRYQNDLI